MIIIYGVIVLIVSFVSYCCGYKEGKEVTEKKCPCKGRCKDKPKDMIYGKEC